MIPLLIPPPSVVTTEGDGGKQQDEGESVGVIVAAASVFSILLVGVTVGTVVLLWRRYIHKEGGMHCCFINLACLQCFFMYIIVNRQRRVLFQQVT